jgi:hypothetical protein
MIDLTTNPTWARFSPAYRPITDLAVGQLSTLKGKIDAIAGKQGLDPYTQAHLSESSRRIQKALDARMTISTNQSNGGRVIIVHGKD